MKIRKIIILFCFVLLSTTMIRAADWDGVTWRDRERHYAFPGVTALDNGDLLAVFREGLTHVEPSGRIVAITSRDGGRTWDKETFRTVVDSEYDDRDPSVARLSDGTLIVNYFQYRCDGMKDNGNCAGAVEGVYVVHSYDGGKTWSKPNRVETPGYEWAATTEPVVEGEDGTLIMPLYGWEKGSRLDVAFLLRSYDGGMTWKNPTIMAKDNLGLIKYQEPSLTRLPSGKMLVALRTAGAGGRIFVARSREKGEKWTRPKDTGIVGVPPNLLPLSDGRLLMTYGYREPPYEMRYVTSANGGFTWDSDKTVVMKCCSENWDFGYPASLETSPGVVVTVYYFTDQQGAHIRAACYKP